MHPAMAYETLHPVTFWFILKVVVTITCCIKVVIFVCVITRTVVFGNSCMLYSRSSLEDVSGDGSLTFLGLPQLLDYYAHHTSIHLGYNIVGGRCDKVASSPNKDGGILPHNPAFHSRTLSSMIKDMAIPTKLTSLPTMAHFMISASNNFIFICHLLTRGYVKTS